MTPGLFPGEHRRAGGRHDQAAAAVELRVERAVAVPGGCDKPSVAVRSGYEVPAATSGSVNQIVVPTPTAETGQILCPWRWMTRRQVTRPTPWPW